MRCSLEELGSQRPTAGNSSFLELQLREPDVLFWSSQAKAFMCINSRIARHIHRININYLKKKTQLFELGVMVHACNLSVWEAEERAWLYCQALSPTLQKNKK